MARNVPKGLVVSTIGPVTSWTNDLTLTRHLKPSDGWLEQVEIDYEPRCDNGEVPERLKQWFGWLHEATANGSKPIRYLHQTPAIMRAQGFVDIRETVVQLPFNTWPQDQHSKEVGRWYNVGLCEGLEALSLGPFTRVFRWPENDVKRLAAEMRPYICDRKTHLYHNL
jgi:hypothetical protein